MSEKNPLIPEGVKQSKTQRYVVTSAPHMVGETTTRGIMLDVIIALVPALVMAVYFFGSRALMLTLITVAACIAFEWLYRRAMKKPASVGDLSAVVTGMLLAFNLPASTPYWVAVAGAAFAIVIVKQLYGGIGKNFMNPALAARVFLTVSFSGAGLMSLYTEPFARLSAFAPVDAVSAATPLAALHAGSAADFTITELLLGQHGGALGEVSALVLLLGGAYLVLRKVISPRIPLVFLGTVALVTYCFPRGDIQPLQWMLMNLLSGGLVLGAVFMATDYATSPVTARGQVFFAIGCGLLTVFIRYFGSYPEGVSFAILIMNACVWLLDKAGMPRRFGKKARKAGEA